MVVRWHFLDQTDSSTATFEINPSDWDTGYKRNVTRTSTVAPGGKTVIQQGSDEAREISFSGKVLTQSMYLLLIEWFQKKHQIQLTDDIGRDWMIMIMEFTPKRERNVSHPWKHSYTVKALIVDWP